MIRHVVMWRLLDEANATRFRDELASCAGLVPGMLSFSVGMRSPGLAASCDVCLVADFEDAAALEAYEAHPQHVRVSARIGPLRQVRHVLDFEA